MAPESEPKTNAGATEAALDGLRFAAHFDREGADSDVEAAHSDVAAVRCIVEAARSGAAAVDCIVEAARSGAAVVDCIVEEARSGVGAVDCIAEAAHFGAGTANFDTWADFGAEAETDGSSSRDLKAPRQDVGS